jgi:hypothetical protein
MYYELTLKENCRDDLPLLQFSGVYLRILIRFLSLVNGVYNMSTLFTCQVTMIHRLSSLRQNIRAVAILLFLRLV